jgi:hypothetical protein
MKKSIFMLAASSVLALTPGCWFGEHHGAYRTVLATFLPTTAEAPSLPPDAPDVQRAAALIGSVLVPEGFTRDSAGTPLQGTNGLVALYQSPGPALVYCRVAVENRTVGAQFYEPQARAPSSQVARLCESLAARFRSEFGDKAVRVRVKSS